MSVCESVYEYVCACVNVYMGVCEFACVNVYMSVYECVCMFERAYGRV